MPPADCGDLPEFFVTADGDGGSTVSEPSDALTTVLTSPVGETFITFADDFEVDQGWTVSGTARRGGV